MSTNAVQAISLQVQKLLTLSQNDQMVRTAATTALGLMKSRIHEEGKDANGSQIGTYSPEYMKVRTGNFGNSGRVSRGNNKGKLKNAGVFSKGKSKGAQRPRYNRTNDTTVVASLTRQMENDEKVVAIGNAVYGIGFSNPLNYQKSQWVETTYKKKIFSLTADEEAAVQTVVQKFVHDALA